MAAKRRVIKPTKEEQFERTVMAKRLIASGLHDGEVKRVLVARYGCSPRTVERYLRRAREMLREQLGKSKAELKAESLGFYQMVKADPNADLRDKLRAQERIDRILGLESPIEVEHSGEVECFVNWDELITRVKEYRGDNVHDPIEEKLKEIELLEHKIRRGDVIDVEVERKDAVEHREERDDETPQG